MWSWGAITYFAHLDTSLVYLYSHFDSVNRFGNAREFDNIVINKLSYIKILYQKFVERKIVSSDRFILNNCTKCYTTGKCFRIYFIACFESTLVIASLIDLHFIQTSVIHQNCVMKSNSTQIMSKRSYNIINLKNFDFINHNLMNINRAGFS